MIDFLDYNDGRTTLVSKNSVIEGNLETLSSLEILGRIEGDVDVTGLLSVYGKLNGNVESTDMIARTGSVINSKKINALYDIFVAQKSNVTGNIQCNSIEVYGNISGDVLARDTVIVRAGGVIFGDVNCKTLIVDNGGIVNGKISLSYDLF